MQSSERKVVAIESESAESQGEGSWVSKLGPGLITGAADDDPSGIATYSQAGAQFGFNTLWTLFFTYPLMVAIQMVSAKIGRVTGRGLATNIRRHYSAWLVYAIVGLLLIANTINIAADLAAMGDALKLLFGGRVHIYALGFGLLSLLLQVFVPYQRYVKVLKWLTLALLAYVATVFAVKVSWGNVATSTVLPHFSFSPAYITTIVAVFGTTISPYLFFWQASQEVEELRANPNDLALIEDGSKASPSFRRIKIDTLIGMGFSNLVAFFIMLTTAVTLNEHGLTNIETSAQAAAALRPIAGNFAFALFSAGIIGTGLLAVPVLAGSAAYALSGALRWKNSLEYPPESAKGFYGVISASTLLGIALCFAPINPIKALYWSAVINGVISVPIMAVMMLLASNAKVMGRFTIGQKLKILGWACTIVMSVAVVAMFLTYGKA
ncbi:divalent metal cation transporter [Undibacterium sp. Jales W-56]|uniref:NRAMP family divalent metal transporter n=1 Tax=Undibacterium sp. Jales W-56 TaxID=2897325 RepID=UPI0021CE50B4|nr:divalent metal cation transporter [Undibacterium sp. Jales W-56]MCU6435283.1 divalent metal cation transporter [Undibacterium sp. Jales W-56]